MQDDQPPKISTCFLESMDGEKFGISIQKAQMSVLCKDMLEDVEDSSEEPPCVPLPMVKTQILKLVVEYMDFFGDPECPSTPTILPQPLPKVLNCFVLFSLEKCDEMCLNLSSVALASPVHGFFL